MKIFQIVVEQIFEIILICDSLMIDSLTAFNSLQKIYCFYGLGFTEQIQILKKKYFFLYVKEI